MSNRFLKFLEEIASTDWEYSDGTPMAGDARKHLDEFYRIAELEQKLADEQKAAGYWMKQSCKDNNRAEKAEKELSHYQGGVEVERLNLLKTIGDLTNMLAEARKQVAMEIMMHLLGMFWTIPYKENEPMIYRDQAIEWLRDKFGLEG